MLCFPGNLRYGYSMTGAELKAWRKKQRLHSTLAAKMFGVSADTWTRWEAKEKLPAYVGLACSAISLGIPPWRPEKDWTK